MPVDWTGCCCSFIWFIVGIAALPWCLRHLKRRWPNDADWWVPPLMMLWMALWVFGTVGVFFLYEWVMGRT
jgi:hypothetical protein